MVMRSSSRDWNDESRARDWQHPRRAKLQPPGFENTEECPPEPNYSLKYKISKSVIMCIATLGLEEHLHP